MAAATSARSSPSPSPRSADTGSTSRSPASSRASSRRAASRGPSTRSILLRATKAGRSAPATARTTYRSPGPNVSLGVEEHEGRVHLGQGVVHGRLHAPRERVERLLEARQVEQHDLAAPRLTTPVMRRRVVCGWSLTMLTLRPTSAFTSVDLPTLGRPNTATKPERKLARGLLAPVAPSGARTLRRRVAPGLPRARTAPRAGRSGAARARAAGASHHVRVAELRQRLQAHAAGQAVGPDPAATAHVRSPRSPAATAAASAARSAHSPAGYAAFSTFTPRWTRPDWPPATAPTA